MVGENLHGEGLQGAASISHRLLILLFLEKKVLLKMTCIGEQLGDLSKTMTFPLNHIAQQMVPAPTS
jgi:hypothetical protein